MKGFEQVLLLIFLCIQTTNSSVTGANTEVVCSKIERQALLTFKKELRDPTNWLSSWIGEDCCTWKGVSCNNRTRQVVKLNLQQSYDATTEHDMLGGEISPSLLELKHLKFLDLSLKNFYGVRIPEFLGSLKSLRYLNLSHAGFSGMVPHQLGNLSNLHFLDLSSNPLHVDSLHWLSHLSFLQFLDMSQVNLSKVTDYWKALNMLPSLKKLIFSSCELNSIPDHLAPPVNLTSLTIIDLSENNFNSSAPDWLFSINGLASLQLSQNGFHGPIPGGLQNMTSLRVLNLSENNFNSTIPDWFYSLSSLTTLDISNNNLRGSIMSVVSNLTSLTRLYLWGNQLEGELPTTLGNLFKLQELYLSGTWRDQSGYGNSFSGPIPPSMGRLSSLRILYIIGSQMNGSIPESFGHLSQLEGLFLCKNFFEGEVSEVHFSNLTRLKSFYASSNSLVLKVSSNWIPPFQLKEIQLRSWQLGPQFPSWLQTQRNISYLDLSFTRISDEIPTWFWNLTSQISYLNFSNNQIHGELPGRLKLDSIESMVFLGSNNLEGPVPLISSNVLQLDLSNNSFSGPISLFLCQEMDEPSILQLLDLSNNLLSDKIPDCWMNWKSLEALNLRNNNFTGSVPSSLGSLLKLQSLHLRNNHLSGELPSSLQNCTELQIIDLDKNEFSGSIPTWLGKSLSKLMVLVLRSNNFGDYIPQELCDLSSLHILDLAHNHLSGTIPQCFSNFRAMATEPNSNGPLSFSKLPLNGEILLSDYIGQVEEVWVIIKGNELEYSNTLMLLVSMDLSDNQLSGKIPKELTRLLGLRSLNLSRNHLIGNIPEKIGDMKLLESLDLSINRLSGGIPQTMSRLTFLSILNLSYNSFSGTIPLSTQLQSFDASCFMGNQGLCGSPLTQNCRVDESNSNDKRGDKDSLVQIEGFYVGMASGFAVGFCGFLGFLLFKSNGNLHMFSF